MNDYSNEIIEYLRTASASVIIAYSVFALAICILSIVAMWKIFVKAGQAGWKSLIPFYNMYILFKICWNTKHFWFYLALTIVASIISSVYTTVNPDSTSAIAIIIGILVIAITIALLCYSIIMNIKLSKAFGHGGWFAVGLIFLPFIFELILAFGESKYIGGETTMNN